MESYGQCLGVDGIFSHGGLKLVTLTPGEECEGSAFGSICLSICMSVRMRNSKIIAPIGLIFLYKKYYTRGSVHL